MKINSSYPVYMVNNPRECAEYFIKYFGFERTYEIHWYVSLKNESHELAFLKVGHETIPNGFKYNVFGAIINFEVDDVDAAFSELVGNVRVVRSLRTEEFGQRHVIIEGPEGILIDLIQVIPPTSEEHIEAYDVSGD